jgi:hypothetical protein
LSSLGGFPLFGFEEFLDMLNFIGRVDYATGVEVDVPLEDFGACPEVVHGDDEIRSGHPEGVGVFPAVAAEGFEFVAQEFADGFEPLFAVDELDGCLGQSVPGRTIKMEDAGGLSAAENELDVFALLFFGPDVVSLEVRIEFENPFWGIEQFEVVLEVTPTDIHVFGTVPGELRDFRKFSVFLWHGLEVFGFSFFHALRFPEENPFARTGFGTGF